MLTAEELLAGGAISHEVEVPSDLLHPPAAANGNGSSGKVTLKPLTISDLQRINKAAKEDDNLSASLMILQALVEPKLKLDDIQRLPAGLARFLVEQINQISGINIPRTELADLVQAPLARACFVLAKEFGWTPEAVSGMTIGQILLYLEMSGQKQAVEL